MFFLNQRSVSVMGLSFPIFPHGNLVGVEMDTVLFGNYWYIRIAWNGNTKKNISAASYCTVVVWATASLKLCSKKTAKLLERIEESKVTAAAAKCLVTDTTDSNSVTGIKRSKCKWVLKIENQVCIRNETRIIHRTETGTDFSSRQCR